MDPGSERIRGAARSLHHYAGRCRPHERRCHHHSPAATRRRDRRGRRRFTARRVFPPSGVRTYRPHGAPQNHAFGQGTLAAPLDFSHQCRSEVGECRAEQKSTEDITQKVYAEVETAERDEGNEQCESAHGRASQKSRRHHAPCEADEETVKGRSKGGMTARERKTSFSVGLKCAHGSCTLYELFDEKRRSTRAEYRDRNTAGKVYLTAQHKIDSDAQ